MATKDSKNTEALDPEIIAALAVQSHPIDPGQAASARMRNTLFQRIHASEADYRFVHSHEGEWVKLLRGVEIKLLREDNASRSFLIRMAPGSRLPHHPHTMDEESLVLEGEVTVQGVHCLPGDYHFAPAGKAHDVLETETGCLLFVRGASSHSARQ